MRKLLLSLLLLGLASTAIVRAQVAINNDGSKPDSSAMLDVKSTTKGILIPRMTTVQRLAILNPAEGLAVYDTDTKSFWYFSHGSGWLGVGTVNTKLMLPFSDTISSPLTLFNIYNSGSGLAIEGGSAGTTGIHGFTQVLSGAGVLGDNFAGGEAVTGRTQSAGFATGAVVGRNDGPGYGVRGFIATDTSGMGIGVLGQVGTGSSKGVAGHFENLNASSATTALEAVTNGTGSGATISNSNTSNVANVLNVTSVGPGVIADHSQGNAGNFFANNTNAVSAGVRGEVNSIFGNEGTAGVYGVSSGAGGYGGYFEVTSATSLGIALEVVTAGTDAAADITNNNANSTQPALRVLHTGLARAGDFSNNNPANTDNVFNVTSIGPGVIADHSQGNAGNFFANNTNAVSAGVRGEVNSIFGNEGTAGVYGVSSGEGGYGGYFEVTSATSLGIALEVVTAGTDAAADITNNNANSTQPALRVLHTGLGTTGDFSNNNASSTANVLNVVSIGPGVIGDHSQGNAGNFFANNSTAVSAGVRGEVNSIFGNAGTAGVYGVASGTGGYAGYFDHTGTGGFGIGVLISNEGSGAVLVADQEGPAGDPAVFQTGGFNVARIDRNGVGFFDGGTQNSGADLAESFDVVGKASDYEPGDVLIISTDADRTVTKSNAPYSFLVAGVYATKPGVLLSEQSINSDLSGKIPMGIVGVIPTKVCDENGPIHRGDFLVTSSKPGYAMRGDPNQVKPGEIIGKAMQEFTGTTGKIKVLVNVK